MVVEYSDGGELFSELALGHGFESRLIFGFLSFLSISAE